MFITDVRGVGTTNQGVEGLTQKLETRLLRACYSLLTGRSRDHLGIDAWFFSNVPQISDEEIFEVRRRMLLVDESSGASIPMEREIFVLRCLFSKAHEMVRERDPSARSPEFVRNLMGGIDLCIAEELLSRAFEAYAQIIPME
jgi:hypothetical protein